MNRGRRQRQFAAVGEALGTVGASASRAYMRQQMPSQQDMRWYATVGGIALVTGIVVTGAVVYKVVTK